MNRILVVEDEKDLAELLTYNLEKEGFQVSCAHDGISGLELARREIPDLILLDLMLPGMLGTDVCKTLRKEPKTARVPIIMVTAKGDEIDRVVGFEVGADDYVTKPFLMRELLLRVRAVIRRQSLDPAMEEVLTLEEIVIDKTRHMVTCADTVLDLTGTEYKLLLYLAERPGRVVTREALLQDVWGYNEGGDTRTIDTHITRVRSKLGAPGDMIKTVRGFGYKMGGR